MDLGHPFFGEDQFGRRTKGTNDRLLNGSDKGFEKGGADFKVGIGNNALYANIQSYLYFIIP